MVGGGFTGLWSALRTKERDPDRDVLLVEADRVGAAASGRNGGFCEASLTHGEHNGQARWPREYETLRRLGQENLAELVRTVDRYGIDCGPEATGMLAVATRPHEVGDLALDRDAVRARVSSPTYLAGRYERGDCVLVDPARLAWRLAAAAESLGVRIVENTTVTAVRARGVETDHGPVTADRVLLATNAFRPLLRRLRWHTVPVYVYVLATEPLTAAQLAAVGWHGREGISDSGNQFHYYRLTADNRIVWGGYDAIYHYGRRIDPALEDRRTTHRVLAEHFYETFPQLSTVRFTHRWAASATRAPGSARSSARRGGVAWRTRSASPASASARPGSRRTCCWTSSTACRPSGPSWRWCAAKPLPFPPEPLAWLGIRLTRRSLAAADRTGRRNLWLRTLDRLGLGFDS